MKSGTNEAAQKELRVLASRGVTRTGENYCMSCFQLLEAEVSRCPGCLSELTEEVKAFLCPKCSQVIALGTPACPKCGLRFKVKAVAAPDRTKDDQFLVKLIEWGGTPKPEETLVQPTAPLAKTSATSPSAEPAASVKPPERLKRLAELKESVIELMQNRSQMLERMQRRIEAEKARLAQISVMEGGSATAEEIEKEIVALADEMADITMLQAHMEALSDQITDLMGSVEIGEETRERGLAAKALRMKLEAKEKELAELKAREEQLAAKEQMVDRKIQAYAQKKKQLDMQEEELKSRLAKLEEERAELERLRAAAAGARTESEREEAASAWREERERLRKMVEGLRSSIIRHRTGEAPTEAEIEAAEGDLGTAISDLEAQIADLIMEKVELQKKISEATFVDEDLRRLLKVLDQLLGQLPEEVIDRFSKSDDFALYEKMLDRLKI